MPLMIERTREAVIPDDRFASPRAADIDGAGETSEQSDLCRSCGACCSCSADWPRFSLESEEHLARIPPEFVDPGQGGMRCTGARCTALIGVVGRSTSCAIYDLRPDVCRACVPGDDACLQARRHSGL
jgi:uncharacterized protein